MLNTIEKWRKKSERNRRVIAFSISLALTLIIATVWATVFFSKAKEEIANEQVIQKGEGTFSSFKKNTAQSYQAFKDQIENIKNVIKKPVDVYEAEDLPGSEKTLEL